jgi:perosamine synthetase
MTSSSKPEKADPAIPLSVPVMQGNEWTYIKECLDTGWVSSVGSYVTCFEKELAAYIGERYAVATSSGSAALHTALMVAGIGADEDVLVSTLTFIASANAIRYVGAHPIFIDAEPNYWQMDAEKVQHFIEERCRWQNDELRNRRTGRRVRAIMPVHILGHPVDMEPIMEIARRYKLTVIEDATEALGSKYKGQMVGTIGDMACFSFNGNKIITTGGGGMLVTDNRAFADRARYLTTQAKDRTSEYIHHEIGYNYRLTNLQAAMGVAQLECLPEIIKNKRQIAERYNTALADLQGITVMPEAEWANSNLWLYTILIDREVFGMDCRALVQFLSDAGIESRPLWQPLHMSKAHHTSLKYDNPVSERLYREAISLPCSANLTEDQQQFVIERILDASKRKPGVLSTL